MKIEQSNQYSYQYTGIGSKNSSKTFENLIDNSSEREQPPSKVSLLTPSTRISYLMPSVMSLREEKMTSSTPPEKSDEIIQPGNGLPVDENVDESMRNLAILEQKCNEMNNILSQLGINGTVTSASMQKVPQNYTMFYVETAAGKNIAIIQLENGAYGIAETSMNREDFFRSWSMFCDEPEFNNGKLSVDKLTEYFKGFTDSDVELVRGALSNSRILQELRAVENL